MTHLTPEELHDWHRDRHGLDAEPPLSWRNLAWIVGTLIALCAVWLTLAFSALRADRPMVCQSLDLRGAECAAAVTMRL